MMRTHRLTPVVTGLVVALAFLAPRALSSSPTSEAAPTSFAAAMIPESHHGSWAGPNRLWMHDPTQPFRSDGTIECTAEGIQYTWSKDDTEHRGTIRLHGQPAALRLALEDTFHAPTAMNLYGHLEDGVVRTYGTYGAGPDQPEWGWILELDWRDPEALVLRMFNVVPDVGAVPAVVLHGTRPS